MFWDGSWTMVSRGATIRSMDLLERRRQHSATVGAALEVFVSNLSVHDQAVVASLRVNEDLAMLTYAFYQPQMESAEQVIDAALAVTANVLQAVCGSDWRPTEVLVPRVRLADPEPY